ncbi:hypothetical protein [Promicromonospora sp. NPDC019610]|uniref:hypothetical protein n=1 Tax=Promicromonospora sp. NPDC019610 TaxID=3364405 RepID=UPI0037B73371
MSASLHTVPLHRTAAPGWVLRAIVSGHLVLIVGQPVFAGVYLSGAYDGLRWHATGADVVTSFALLQLIVAVVVRVRLRLTWPALASLALLVAESVQYYAGRHGELWLHLPLGVMTIAALVVLFIAVWRAPLSTPPGVARA